MSKIIFSRIIGCNRFSSQSFSDVLSKIISLSLDLSSLPFLSTIFSPKCCLIFKSAWDPEETESLATTSALTTLAPSFSKYFAAVDLPLPMPPVRPTTKRLNGFNIKCS